MIRKMSWLGLVALLGTVGLVLPSAAEAPKTGDPAKQEAHANDVELLAQAYQLAEIAEKQKLPEAYVAAGGLVLKFKALTKGELGTLDAKPEVLDENDKPVKEKVETVKPESLDDIAQGFFDSAAGLAKEQKMAGEVKALTDAAKARKYDSGARGAIGGPRTIVRSLGAHKTHVYNIPVDTFSIFAVGFQSSGPTRCKMEHGGHVQFNQVVNNGTYTMQPKATKGGAKTFTITVSNGQKYPVTYRLWTN